MADNKIEKALYGPSITEVALGAILGLFVGVLAACVYLVFKPVQQVKEMPEKSKQSHSVVYYLPGNESGSKSRGWQTKYKQFLAGNSISVVEDELNAWAASLAAPAGAPKPAKAGTPAPKPGDAKQPVPEGIFIPGKPNFRVVDGKLQIGLTCTLNWYGLMQDVTVIATGGFRRDGSQTVFVPDTLYLGSCPLHMFPSTVTQLANHLTAREKIPDEVKTAWAKVSNALIEGATLKLAVQ